MSETTNTSEETLEKRLTKRDLVMAYLAWQTFSHANYNYERLQATGFVHSMIPAIRRLYSGDTEATRQALKRHLVFYNTSPDVGAVINGAALAMEEQKANGLPVSDDAINSMKTGLMGPLAGIGDTITQGIAVPLLLALGISLTGLGQGVNATDAGITGNVLGPIVYLILIVAFVLGTTWFTLTQGYYRGRSAITQVFKTGLMDRVIMGAGVLGNLVLGGLAASFVALYVGASITAGDTNLRVQEDILDKIMPGLLPLSLVLFTWWMLKRGWHPIRLLLIYVTVCILGAIPLLGPAPQFVSDACGSSILQPYSSCGDPMPVESAE